MHTTILTSSIELRYRASMPEPGKAIAITLFVTQVKSRSKPFSTVRTLGPATNFLKLFITLYMQICLGRKVVGPVPIKPQKVELKGRYACLKPLDPNLHAERLYQNFKNTQNLWLYLFDDEPKSVQQYRQRMIKRINSPDLVIFAVFDVRDLNQPIGTMNYMRIEPSHRCLEIGSITFSSKLQKSRVSTQALFLIMKYCFQLGYFRLQWKCNNNNLPSKKAALRLGFTYQGCFRRHMIIKDHCRDTAWFAMIDQDWPTIKAQFERYLDPSNFDEDGIQKTKLTIKTQ